MKKNIKINANWTDVEADTMIERVTKSLSDRHHHHPRR